MITIDKIVESVKAYREIHYDLKLKLVDAEREIINQRIKIRELRELVRKHEHQLDLAMVKRGPIRSWDSVNNG